MEEINIKLQTSHGRFDAAAKELINFSSECRFKDNISGVGGETIERYQRQYPINVLYDNDGYDDDDESLMGVSIPQPRGS